VYFERIARIRRFTGHCNHSALLLIVDSLVCVFSVSLPRRLLQLLPLRAGPNLYRERHCIHRRTREYGGISAPWQRPWLAPSASIFGLKFASRLNLFGRYGLGARSAIYWGLVMGIEHLLRNKQRRLAESSLRVDENTDCAVSPPEENDAPSLWGDEHSDDMQSLLEENALLRRMLVKMDLVLKKVVDPK
jgi:hypothetical protein